MLLAAAALVPFAKVPGYAEGRRGRRAEGAKTEGSPWCGCARPGVRNAAVYPRAVRRFRVDGQDAADGGDAVVHVAQSGSARRPVAVIPEAGVADREMHRFGGIPGTHRNLSRSGVLGCIVDRRQAGEVDRALDVGPAAAD